jgi:hypothetical protein
MAGLLGWVPPERFADAEQLNVTLVAKLNETEVQAERLNREIDSMVRAETARIRRPRQKDKLRKEGVATPWTPETQPNQPNKVSP